MHSNVYEVSKERNSKNEHRCQKRKTQSTWWALESKLVVVVGLLITSPKHVPEVLVRGLKYEILVLLVLGLENSVQLFFLHKPVGQFVKKRGGEKIEASARVGMKNRKLEQETVPHVASFVAFI